MKTPIDIKQLGLKSANDEPQRDPDHVAIKLVSKG